jgi:hypothetical protein
MDKNEKVITSLGFLEVDEGQNKVQGWGMFFLFWHFDVSFSPSFVSHIVFLDVF